MAAGLGKLSGRKIVLTGGAGEIGRTVAEVFLREGATVVITGRDEGKLEQAARSLREAVSDSADRIWCLRMDGADPVSLEAAARELGRRFGTIDVLVNNAGGAGERRPLREVTVNSAGSEESLAAAIESLLGTAWMTTCALRPLFAPNASVINVSTIFAKTPYFGRVPYVVPKAALNAFGAELARELGADPRGIRVNTILPGPVETDRIHRVWADMDRMKESPQGSTRAEILGTMGLRNDVGGRFVQKDEIAETMLFLASDASLAITGHEFEASRGMRTAGDSTTNALVRPDLATIDLHLKPVWIIAGNQLAEACEFARRFHATAASVLLSFSDEAVASAAREQLADRAGIRVAKLDPLQAADWERVRTEWLAVLQQSGLAPAFVVLPPTARERVPLMSFSLKEIRDFLREDLMPPIAVAQQLDRLIDRLDPASQPGPSVIFLTGGPERGHANPLERMRSESVRQLIRCWRDERRVLGKERAGAREQINQVVRFDCPSASNADIAADWAIWLASGMHAVDSIDIRLDPSLGGQARRPVCGGHEGVDHEIVAGLHAHKVALVTGGSEGIGGEICRQLSVSGAKLAIAERNLEKLNRARERLVAEMTAADYPDPQARLLTMHNCDVVREDQLSAVVPRTIERYGRIDYLVNNAGLTGAERMIVDMPLESWNQTLAGNLLSNYQLLLAALPHMKRQGGGHIINMSSYFGGNRHGYVAYTNRADYAVSKAGQIGLADILSGALGPEVQINTLAPGPVDGARLNGTEGRPGLYSRRACLIWESRRLNVLHTLALQAVRAGESIETVLRTMVMNRVDAVLASPQSSATVKREAAWVTRGADANGSASRFLMNRTVFDRLVDRLSLLTQALPAGAIETILRGFEDPPAPFFSDEQVARGAKDIRQKIIERFSLGRMPTDRGLACEVVCSLAHKTVTGEVFYPTCGFKYEGHTLSNNFRHDGTSISPVVTASFGTEALSLFEGQTVFVIGRSMGPEMLELLSRLSRGARDSGHSGVSRIVLGTTVEYAKGLAGHIPENIRDLVRIETCDLHADPTAFRKLLSLYGHPRFVFSTPTAGLEGFTDWTAQGWQALPTLEQFKGFVRDQLTAHFLLAREVSLLEGCHTFLLAPAVKPEPGGAGVLLRRFVDLTLPTLTLAAGGEGEHLFGRPVFYQLDGSLEPSAMLGCILELCALPPKNNGKK